MARAGVAILGAGQMGQGLALALRRSHHPVFLVSRTLHPVIAPLRLHRGDRSDAIREAGVVLLAVPDDAIAPVASELAREGAVESRHAVLHLSGLLDRGALGPLVPTGAALGSFHPLQTVSDPASAPERLRGRVCRSRRGRAGARRRTSEMATALGMTAVAIPPAAQAGLPRRRGDRRQLHGRARRRGRATGGVGGSGPRRGAASLPAPDPRGGRESGDGTRGRAHRAGAPRGRGRPSRPIWTPSRRATGSSTGSSAREALRLAREAGLPAESADRVARALGVATGKG